jgi:hypothetical protein
VRTLEIHDSNVNLLTDLTLSLDHSSTFFISSLFLYNGTTDYKHEIRPIEVMDDIKNIVKYRFSKLKSAEYSVVITFTAKPSKCWIIMKLHYESQISIE